MSKATGRRLAENRQNMGGPGYRPRRQVLKIILLGDSGVGKTSLMRQFVSGRFENRYKATIGADFFTHQEEIDGQTVDLQIWDTAGQERFQSLGSAFYRGADACILAFDITQGESFSHLQTWLHEFALQAGKKDIVVVGNKADLQEKRQVFVSGVKRFCQENVSFSSTVVRDEGEGGAESSRLPYFEVSAKTATNVREAFRCVASGAFRTKMSTNEEVANLYQPQSIRMKANDEAQNEPEKKRCC